MTLEEIYSDFTELPSLDPSKKKKKKKPMAQVLTDGTVDPSTDKIKSITGDIGEDEKRDASDGSQELQYPWEGTSRDYMYEELQGRLFNILREKNPVLVGDRCRIVIRPPQVMRQGSRKTLLTNFTDLCKIMHRQPEHVMSFLLAELQTSGSLDGQQRLVVKGIFAPRKFESLLRSYIREYVTCNGCKSSDTILSKEDRLLFLRCELCGSGRCISS